MAHPDVDFQEVALPESLPILPLRGMVVYPLTSVPLNVGQPRSVKLIDDATGANLPIGLFASRNPELRTPGASDIYRVGTVAAVHRLLRQPDGTVRLMVNGQQRVRLKEVLQTTPYLHAVIEPCPEHIVNPARIDPLAHHVAELFQRLAEFVPTIPGTLIVTTLKSSEPLQLAYTVAHYLRPGLEDAQKFIEIDSVDEKLEWLIAYVNTELNVLEMGKQIRLQAASQIEQAQRDHFLREQLKAIQRELGEDDGLVEAARLSERIALKQLPPDVMEEVERDLNRLPQLPAASAEYSTVRHYLDWIASLPWNEGTIDNLDLRHAARVLDEDHFGLRDIKQRVIEHLAVRQLRETRATAVAGDRPVHASTILCLVGPPGVGKTSLGQSIARAMGRKFARISLGGMRDEAEIRGHRRTYIGAQFGQIMHAIQRAGSNNPVIVLDEIDKLGRDFRGDPGAALLEVLDPEQNRHFHDNYLDVPFDLSRVLFLTTANTLDAIPPALLDRMEVVELPGYTEREKIAIARQYLVPRQIADNGLHPEEIFFQERALQRMIQDYTREAGVRSLDRHIGRVCRKVATAVAIRQEARPTTRIIQPQDLPAFLGPIRYHEDTTQRTQLPGVAVGLAWTAVGGQIIFVEARMMPGQKGLTITGNVGDLLRESVQAALSLVRSQAVQLGQEPDFFDRHDIHVHVPAGAVPKDGPSAGITIVTALASLLTDSPVRPDLAMTGEITLSGHILPVGGIKQKVLAAHRAGLQMVLLPKQNLSQLADIPEEVQQELHIQGVEHVNEVLEIAFGSA